MVNILALFMPYFSNLMVWISAQTLVNKKREKEIEHENMLLSYEALLMGDY